MAKFFTRPPLGTPLNPAHPLNRGLVLYMPFSEGAGSKTQDLSGKGNHGTLTNIVQSATSGFSGGKFGGAMRFDGVDDYVKIPNSATGSLDITNHITMSAWYNPSRLTRGDIMGKSTDNTTQYFFIHGIPDGVPLIMVGSTSLNGTILPINQWVHVVGVYDGAFIRVYQNGVQVSSVAKTGTSASQNKDVTIGSYVLDAGGAWGTLLGSISDVRIYNRALSPLEVQQLYTDPFCMYEQKGLSRWAQLIKKGSFFFR